MKQVLIFVALLIFSCKEKHTIDLPKMANIMTDVHLADAYAGLVYTNDTLGARNNFNKNMDTLKVMYGHIFKRYQVSEQQFMQHVKLYQQNPILWDSLYSMVQKRLTAIRPKELH
jgi:Domain of unknown function (DUF4296)